MYDAPDELLTEILAGRDSKLDWKEVVLRGKERDKATAELAKDLTCFANADGGVVVFGVRKDGERVGLAADRMDDLQQLILNVAQNNIEPPMGHLLVFDRIWLPDSSGELRLCLKLEIQKALWSVHAPRGRRPYWRIADQCHEMTLDQQARAFERRGMMPPFEERPVFSATAEDLDLSRFKAYYEVRYEGKWTEGEVPLTSLMRKLKLIVLDESGGEHPTGLGLLLFAPRPDQWISGAYVDLAVYEGTEPDAGRQRDAKTIRGSIVEQMETTLTYLQMSPYVPVPARKDHLGRLDLPAYSLRARCKRPS